MTNVQSFSKEVSKYINERGVLDFTCLGNTAAQAVRILGIRQKLFGLDEQDARHIAVDIVVKCIKRSRVNTDWLKNRADSFGKYPAHKGLRKAWIRQSIGKHPQPFFSI